MGQGYLEQGDEQLIFACDTNRVKRIFSNFDNTSALQVITLKYN